MISHASRAVHPEFDSLSQKLAENADPALTEQRVSLVFGKVRVVARFSTL
jgi:hypothetical protein